MSQEETQLVAMAVWQEVAPPVGVTCSTHRKRLRSYTQGHASPALPPHTSAQAEQNTAAACRQRARTPARTMLEGAAVAEAMAEAQWAVAAEGCSSQQAAPLGLMGMPVARHKCRKNLNP